MEVVLIILHLVEVPSTKSKHYKDRAQAGMMKRKTYEEDGPSLPERCFHSRKWQSINLEIPFHVIALNHGGIIAHHL